MATFNDAYRGAPPWDIGRPQREFVALEGKGEVRGDVVDLGCGTGEQAIFFSSKGHRVLGLDSAPIAIAKAKEKATLRGSKAEFLEHDALELPSLGKKFDTATDCALFHVFPDQERARYVRSVSEVVRTGGRYLMLCFSEKEPTDWGGPRRVSQAEIRQAFSDGWRVDYINPGRLETTLHKGGGEAWVAALTRLP
ncbi:MAG: class I SAM-dependent methyltransferase [Thaumarchaeota archaeon]|nr:class I SAM-dependent methyltransferase [Nitrososphaerota archaeon]